jgi:predicted transcriptional regulator
MCVAAIIPIITRLELTEMATVVTNAKRFANVCVIEYVKQRPRLSIGARSNYLQHLLIYSAVVVC